MGDDEVGKLFIGAVDKDTSPEEFKAFFESYGELADWILMTDDITHSGRNRGFGFVKYKDPSNADDVLNGGPVILNGKKVDPKRCTPRSAKGADRKPQGGGQGGEVDSPNKIFVGGIPQGMTEDELSKAFSKYGKVTKAKLMMDKTNNRHKGFGFITFDQDGPAQQLCSMRFVDCGSKKVEIKQAETRFQGGGPVFGGPGGGYGGGGGGNWQGGGQGGGGYGYGQGGGGWGGGQQQMGGGGWGPPQQMGNYGQGGFGGGQGGYGGGGRGGNQGGGYGGGYGGAQNGGNYGGGGQGGGYSGGQYGQGGYGSGNEGGDASPPAKSNRYSSGGGGQGGYGGGGYGGGYGGGGGGGGDMYGSGGGGGGGNYGPSGGYHHEASGFGPHRGNFGGGPGGMPPHGGYGGDMGGGGYGGGGGGGQDMYGSGGPMSGNYQRMGNNPQFHPYRR